MHIPSPERPERVEPVRQAHGFGNLTPRTSDMCAGCTNRASVAPGPDGMCAGRTAASILCL